MYKMLFLLLFSMINVVKADGIKALNNFLQKKNNSISADFSQTVTSSKSVKTTIGTMEIERPNKFRWHYVKEEQLIVNDGKYIYIYDKPLQQVTINKLGNMLGKSPALLLAGSLDIKKYYNITSNPDADNLEWVTLTPKDTKDNNGFKVVQIAFNKVNQVLTQMKFIDTFDNKITIEFSNMKIGNKFPKNEFIFVVPKNTDVIKAD